MDVTLVFPGLLDVGASALGAAGARAPALGRIVAVAPAPAVECDGVVALACAEMGIARQRDWPVAPWLARAAGIDARGAYWLCVEPATYAVDHADVRLSEWVGDLAASESSELLATLNAHFAGDDVCFVAPEASRWLLRTQAVQALETHPPHLTRAAPLLALLPSGPDAPRWLRWQNEIQMLLFEHRVNRQRQAAGLAPVNGVWLWGGGTLDDAGASPRAASFYGQAVLPRELARARRVSITPLPASFHALRAMSAPTPALVWFDAFDERGAIDLPSRLADVDRAWTAPAADALAEGALRALDIVITGRTKSLRFNARPPSMLRRLGAWRSPPRLDKALAAHMTAA